MSINAAHSNFNIDFQPYPTALERTRKNYSIVYILVLVDSMETLKPCTCNHSVVTKYQKRISGPMLDRIDIHIEVPRVDYEKLSIDRLGESSASIRERVQAARERQRIRFGGRDIVCNSDVRVAEVRQFCKL